MNITPDISMGNILTIIVAIAVPLIGFVISLIVLKTTVGLEKKRTDEKLDAMDKRIDKLQSESNSGYDKFQASLTYLTNMLGEVKTKVEVLFDRDEREERAPPRTTRSRTKTGA